MLSTTEVVEAIAEYANAYSRLQRCQEQYASIPEGDQKTGCIGEYYAFLYLAHQHPNASLTYGSHSQKGWDLDVSLSDRSFKVQVKTVSAYSKTRSISPIHHGWDQLFLIYVGRDFIPQGFWIVENDSLISPGEIWKGRKCRKPDNPNSGSKSIPFGANRTAELNDAIAV